MRLASLVVRVRVGDVVAVYTTPRYEPFSDFVRQLWDALRDGVHALFPVQWRPLARPA